MASTRGERRFDDRLEKLRRGNPAVAQCREVLGHTAVGDPVEPIGVEPLKAQIVLQAQPRGRNLADRGKPHLRQVGQPEIGIAAIADNRERIAADDLGKADKRRIAIVVVMLHDPHRARPR